MKPRGRPRNATSPKLVRADDLTARVAHRLIMWGFPRRTVFARLSLLRTTAERPLKADRIEQIYEAWATQPMEGRFGRPGPIIRSGRRNYTKESLMTTAPLYAVLWPNSLRLRALSELAAMLLDNDGEWPERRIERNTFGLEREAIPQGESLEMTPAASARLASARAGWPKLGKRGS